MRRITALCLDAAAVIGFVALGRESHAEGEAVAGIALVAAPFLVGAAVGWAICRRTVRPAGLRTGIAVWAATIGIGMVLREAVFARPTPIQFVAVGGAFLGLMIVGWRAAWLGIGRVRSRPAAVDVAPDGPPAS